jgi:capsular exopolysaccharide synthesis family protein
MSTLQTSFLHLLQNIQGRGAGGADRIRVVGVTSCRSGEGVSTIAVHIALAASAGRAGKVLLVDANLARPRVHTYFAANCEPGLAEAIGGTNGAEVNVQSTQTARLWMVAAGNPGALKANLSREPLAQAFATWKSTFDLIVVDMPPANDAGLHLPLAGLVDGVVLVVEHERVRWEVARRVTWQIGQAGGRVLGVVLNKRTQHIPDWLYRTLP